MPPSCTTIRAVIEQITNKRPAKIATGERVMESSSTAQTRNACLKVSENAQAAVSSPAARSMVLLESPERLELSTLQLRTGRFG